MVTPERRGEKRETKKQFKSESTNFSTVATQLQQPARV
jgi:hypothetical protein